jgi:integrase
MELMWLGVVLRHGGIIAGCPDAAARAGVALAGVRLSLRHAGKVAPSNRRDRRPTHAELTKLLLHWSKEKRAGTPMKEITLFAISTAMRLGEICSLEWRDLNEAERTIMIRQRKHPSSKETNDQVVPLLNGPFVFQGENIDPLGLIHSVGRLSADGRLGARIFPYNVHSVSTKFTRSVKATKINDLRFHDLRHEGISLLFEAGYSIEQVSLVSGHRDWKQLQRYTQIKPSSLHRMAKDKPIMGN